MDLHNGVLAARTPITQALWFDDNYYSDGMDLIRQGLMEKVPPAYLDFYVAIQAAIQRNDRKGFLLLEHVKRLYPKERLWNAALERQYASWQQLAALSEDVLMDSGIPFFEGIAWRFRGVGKIKERNKRRTDSPDRELQPEEREFEARELQEILSDHERALKLFQSTSAYETGRCLHELAKQYPHQWVDKKVACARESIVYFKKCQNPYYVFNARIRLGDCLELHEVASFADPQKSRYLGDLIRTIKQAETIEAFAERTITLLTSSAFLDVGEAVFTKVEGKQERIIDLHPKSLESDPAFDHKQFYVEDLGYGYQVKISKLTDPDALRLFLSDVRTLFHQLYDALRFTGDISSKKSEDELPYTFENSHQPLKFYDRGWKKPLQDIRNSAQSSNESAILLLGETGVGKSLIAKGIHFYKKENSAANWVEINCAQLGSRLQATPDTRDDYDIWGWSRDAYSGSKQPGPSVFDVAGTGTVFFDEIGELPMSVQGRLLSVIQHRTYRKKGVTRDLPIHCRIIAATNRPVLKWAGEFDESNEYFRKDLVYRFKNNVITLPSLSETPLQVPYLARLYAGVQCAKEGFTGFFFNEKAEQFLLETEWTGNCRMVEAVICRAIEDFKSDHPTVRDLEFTPDLLRGAMRNLPEKSSPTNPPPKPPAYIDEVQKALLSAPNLTQEQFRDWILRISTKNAESAESRPATPTTVTGQKVETSRADQPDRDREVPPGAPTRPAPKAETLAARRQSALETGAEENWKATFESRFDEILEHLKRHIKPMSRVIPSEFQPYLKAIQKQRSVPKPNSFMKIQTCFLSPLLVSDQAIRPTIHAFLMQYWEFQRHSGEVQIAGENLEHLEAVFHQTAGVKTGPEPTAATKPFRRSSGDPDNDAEIAPAPLGLEVQSSIKPRDALILSVRDLIWSLLKVFPYRKSDFFKRETVQAFYALKAKPYRLGDALFLDAYDGFRRSPLYQERKDDIERLYSLYMKLSQLSK